MNCVVTRGIANSEVYSMMQWCRENQIPIVEAYKGASGRTRYFGSKRWTADHEPVPAGVISIKKWHNFLIRDCDLALWKLRFT